MTFVVNITSNGAFVKRKERDVHKKRSIGHGAMQLEVGGALRLRLEAQFSGQRAEIRGQRSDVRGQDRFI
jgi:hypothetical protein